MMKGLRIFSLLLIIIFFYSCKKNKDSSPPVIIIIQPSENQQCDAIDTILVNATVSDDLNIENITMYLVNNLFTTTGHSQSIPVHDKKSQTIDQEFIIDDIHLESGIYYLEIDANDGTNTTKEYVKLNINAIPKTLTEVYVFCNDNNTTRVYQINSTGTYTEKTSINEKFADAAINSYNQEIGIISCGGNLRVHYPSDFSVLWTKSYPHLISYPFSGKTEIIDNYLFAGFTEGNIYGYDKNGVERQSATITSSNHSPGLYYKHNDYLFVADIPTKPVLPKIEKLNYESGIYIDEYEIDFDIIKFSSYDDDHLLIWGNKNNEAKICTINVVSNVMYQINGFPQEEILTVEQIDNDTWLFSSSVSIYTYHIKQGTTSTYLNLSNCYFLNYEPITEKLYIADSTQLMIYDYLNKSLENTINMPDNILKTCFLYNK